MSTITYDSPLAVNYNDYHAQDENLFNLQVEKIMSYLNLNKSSTVIDAGCGAGRLIIPISDRVKRVVGVELSNGMATQAVENITRSGIGNVSIHQNSWDKQMPYLDKVDGIYFSMSLHQMGSKEEQLKILNDSFKVLKDDGKILLITISNKQFSEILLNRFFPGLDAIDKNRFIDIDELKNVYPNIVSIEEHIVYKVYDKDVFLNMVENKYISSLQMISEESFQEGFKALQLEYELVSEIVVPDCYTYITFRK